jgi:hypothetical protein
MWVQSPSHFLTGFLYVIVQVHPTADVFVDLVFIIQGFSRYDDP